MSDDDDVNSNGHHTSGTSPSPPLPPPHSKTSPSNLTPTTQPPSRPPPVFPAREDCWTEAATHTLIEAWGSHHIELNRGNLRQKHWQEVADAVNALHAHTKKQHRTDIQCKNRIDTLKKRYKIEKSQTLQSNGLYVSSWPFFNTLDNLIGDTFLKNNLSVSPSPSSTSPASAIAITPYRKNPQVVVTATPIWKTPPVLPPPPSAVPVGPRSKRPISEEALSRRNFSAMAAAAARAAEEDDDDNDDGDDDSEMSGAVVGAGGGGSRTQSRGKEAAAIADGYKRLAEAIGRFAEIYERVEEAKQRQMVELEMQRMQFAKDLEIQRMKLFMESQVQLEKIKRVKRNSTNGDYS